MILCEVSEDISQRMFDKYGLPESSIGKSQLPTRKKTQLPSGNLT